MSGSAVLINALQSKQLPNLILELPSPWMSILVVDQQNRATYLRQEKRHVLSAYRAAEDKDFRENDPRPIITDEHYQEVLHRESKSLFSDRQDKADRASYISAVLFSVSQKERTTKS